MSPRAGPTIDELVVAGEPRRWSGAGFAVDPDGVCRAGSVRLRLAGNGAGRGIVRWSVRDLAFGGGREPDLDGVPTDLSSAPPADPARHANGVLRLDHLVAFTPDLGRTVAALERGGLDLRRVREGRLPGGGTRQAFFRLGETILEAIEQPAADGAPVDPARPARLWGFAFLVADLDATATFLGDRLGSLRDAVQPGRRIATIRRSAGLGVAVAFITPGAGGDAGG